MTSRKAQGTMEYLIIIAVVVVIGLVVAGILIGMSSGSGNTSKSGAKLAWQSKAVAIMDAVAYNDGNAIFTLRNNVGEPVAVNSFTINGNLYTVVGGSKNMAINQTAPVQVTGVVPLCTSNDQVYKVRIDYTSVYSNLPKNVPEGDYYVSCIGSSGGASSFNFSGPAVAGAIPISDGVGGFYASGADHNGIVVLNNSFCFGGTECDANVGSSGTDLVFYG